MIINEQVIDIKKELRSYMNGIVADSMRKKGADYKIIFGVEFSDLKEIAGQYGKNQELAQLLWKENIRECKILAGMLQPVETFDEEFTDLWVDSMSNLEIIQYTVMNLFQYLPFASKKAFQWIASENENLQFIGFTLLSRLFTNGAELNERALQEFEDQVYVLINTSNLALKKIIVTAVNNCNQLKDKDILSDLL